MNPKEKYFDLSPFSSLIIRFLFGDEGGMKLGDFNEVYNDLIERKGSLRARFSFWNYVLLSILQNTKSSIFRSYDMFKNYMKIIFRNFKRQKGYTFINVFGLSVGITCFIFIMMYVKYELSYDTFNENSDRIHRIIQHYEAWNFRGSSEFASTNGAMANVLPDEFSEIEYAIRVRTTQSALKYGQNSIVEIGIFADKDFLNTFTYPLIAGDPNNALKDPNSIVLTEELADKLFNDENPIGKVLQGSNGLTFQVTGICENIPDNSHLQFDFIISFRTMYSLRNDIDTSWGILNYANYVLLKENIDYREFEKKLDLLIEKYHAPSDIVRHYYLQPVTDIHLDSHINTFMDTPGDRKYIYLFSTVAFLILIIASVNYVNLATSRASLRGKEVGIRKTVGALRTELMKQFLGESIMLTLFALSVSLIIVYMIHPLFQNFIGQNIPLDLLLNPVSLAGLFLLIFTVGFISGCYPSFLLSSFRPVNVLKPGAKTINVNNRFKLRNILVVFQFFVSVVLIVATLVINKQLSFIMNKDIGYQRENIITVRLWDSQNAEKFEIIKEELVRNSNIINVTVSDRAPLRASENNTVRVEDETSGEMVSLAQVSHFYVDHDFIDVYNMNVTDGRNFLKEFSTDEYQGVIVNRTLVNTLGLKNPIGKRFYSPNRNDARIIGVVEDFHFASFTYKIGAIVMMQRPQWGSRVMSLKVSDNDLAGTLDYIQSNFQGHIPDFVFSYEFLDDRFNSIYNTESRMGNLFTVFSMIALVIASVGLLGLISSIAAQKTKEIGIRKILGASVTKITGLVISEFVVLVIISSLIALPVSYFAMSNWLSDFAYRTDITIWTMLLSSLIAFIIAAISVIFQVVKAARANPVESMRYE